MRKSAIGVCDSQGTAENPRETDPGAVRQKGVLFRGKKAREFERGASICTADSQPIAFCLLPWSYGSVVAACAPANIRRLCSYPDVTGRGFSTAGFENPRQDDPKEAGSCY